ncbi:MAG: AAA family ATPase [Promethearchaeota archaeon]
MEHQSKILPKRDPSPKSAPELKSLTLMPVGYPLRAKSEDISPFLTTDDPTLFQHYARSQWTGLIVKEGDFLFDSLLFPDYAFRAINVEPNMSKISKKSQIVLFSDEIPDPPFTQSQDKVELSDIIGQEYAKEKCQVIAKFLKDPDLVQSVWAPHNILFWGPPGNGKTMMARALSQTTSYSMFLIKASDLMGVYAGDGARKIRNLYAEARKKPPAIIFLDELDSIGLKRSYQSIRGDVVELVSALLGEMDGIGKNQGLITIGSTNQPKILDSAILSRFEELIEFKLPNTEERKKILEKYASTSPIKFNTIPWDSIAQETQNWSARDLKDKIIKNAIHYAILQEKSQISLTDIKRVLRKATVLSESLPHYS